MKQVDTTGKQLDSIFTEMELMRTELNALKGNSARRPAGVTPSSLEPDSEGKDYCSPSEWKTDIEVARGEHVTNSTEACERNKNLLLHMSLSEVTFMEQVNLTQ